MPTIPTVLITGAGSGIGRAMARAFARAHYAVILCGRTIKPLQNLARQIQRAGGQALPLSLDVTQPDLVQQAVRTALETFGRLDVLINNAGYAPMAPIADVTSAQWREILDTNLSSAFYLTRAVWETMRNQHAQALARHQQQNPNTPLPRHANTGGVIINISSEAARDPFPGLGAYACAKAGLNMLTYVTAREGEPVGIRAMAIAPAAVETPMFRRIASAEQFPPEEILRPEEVAAVALEFVQGPLRFASGETLYLHRRM